MIILASASASRKAMLCAAGIEFHSIVSKVDESKIKAELVEKGEGPRAISRALAIAKAKSVSLLHPEALVLGSDSIASAEGKIFDKPASRDDAAEHLRIFSGKVMVLDSAAALCRSGEVLDWCSDDAHLEVRPLSENFIQNYLDHEWPAISGCVGCFRIEARGVQLFENLIGNHFTILGMPLIPVLHMLRELGEELL